MKYPLSYVAAEDKKKIYLVVQFSAMLCNCARKKEKQDIYRTFNTFQVRVGSNWESPLTQIH